MTRRREIHAPFFQIKIYNFHKFKPSELLTLNMLSHILETKSYTLIYKTRIT